MKKGADLRRCFAALPRFLLAWAGAFFMLLLRATSRVRVFDDPRVSLRRQKQPYVYAILHCHQIAAVRAAEAGTVAMVSRSTDGDLLIPSLRVCRVQPIRGSSNKGGRSKGGATALRQVVAHVSRGAPACLAVDGPRGPRNHVHQGIAKLAQTTGAAVLVATVTASRRWILPRTWDRMQIPKPFARMELRFAAPLYCRPGDDLELFCQRVSACLTALEEQADAQEARAARNTGMR